MIGIASFALALAGDPTWTQPVARMADPLRGVIATGSRLVMVLGDEPMPFWLDDGWRAIDAGPSCGDTLVFAMHQEQGVRLERWRDGKRVSVDWSHPALSGALLAVGAEGSVLVDLEHSLVHRYPCGAQREEYPIVAATSGCLPFEEGSNCRRPKRKRKSEAQHVRPHWGELRDGAVSWVSAQHRERLTFHELLVPRSGSGLAVHLRTDIPGDGSDRHAIFGDLAEGWVVEGSAGPLITCNSRVSSLDGERYKPRELGLQGWYDFSYQTVRRFEGPFDEQATHEWTLMFGSREYPEAFMCHAVATFGSHLRVAKVAGQELHLLGWGSSDEVQMVPLHGPGPTTTRPINPASHRVLSVQQPAEG
mgnify:CR=1 FL=1